jgi:hypothetical protein
MLQGTWMGRRRRTGMFLAFRPGAYAEPPQFGSLLDLASAGNITDKAAVFPKRCPLPKEVLSQFLACVALTRSERTERDERNGRHLRSIPAIMSENGNSTALRRLTTEGGHPLERGDAALPVYHRNTANPAPGGFLYVPLRSLTVISALNLGFTAARPPLCLHSR